MISARTLVQRSFSVLFLASASVGFSAGSSARAAAAPAPINEALEQAMGQLQQSMKALGKGINAETQAAALEELAKIEAAILTAKTQTPDTAATVDEKKRADFVAEFRTTLLEALKLACDAEIAVVNGKYKEAEGILRGKLSTLKSASHDKFKGED
ncbi:MAG: hypothetical protein HOP15_11100 [Planctomycetes bacterium]|nr:hypothetical protein [Planctomycetota bacterium]